MAGGIGANRFWDRTLQWFADEGMAGVERLHGAEWQTVEHLQSDEAKRIFNEVFTPWAMQRSKADLYHGGQARQIPIAPVSSPADLLESRQLQSRGHFIDLAQRDGRPQPAHARSALSTFGHALADPAAGASARTAQRGGVG